MHITCIAAVALVLCIRVQGSVRYSLGDISSSFEDFWRPASVESQRPDGTPQKSDQRESGVCANPAVFRQTFELLQSEITDLLTSYSINVQRVILESDIEANRIREFDASCQEFHAKYLECKREQAEAQRDVDQFRTELEELRQIGLADVGEGGIAWPVLASSTSALGAHALILRQRGVVAAATQVDQAADMRGSLENAAKLASRCRQKAVSIPSETGEPDTKTDANKTTTECEVLYARFRQIYRQAYMHIERILAEAEAAADDGPCIEASLAWMEERRLDLMHRVNSSRSKRCEAYTVVTDAVEQVTQIQALLRKLTKHLKPGCLPQTWGSMSSDVETLANLVQGSPRCDHCCVLSGAEEVSSFASGLSARVEEVAAKAAVLAQARAAR
eukprot:TRINITY_DN28683_c0_g1_i1.p1 TRINITY_DN28683_c0_g1~~TRINITY_DN28683_c0_g1_i1.p1  ORF type:complete len:390 (-),score=57.26 TRINITY_DN28683_c0_g1_i1:83-1252(-)